MAMATSTDRPTFTTPVERAALALAEEHKVAAIRCINFIPINETDSSLSAADIALFLLSLPRELPFRKLVLSIDRQYTNIPEKLIAKWCLLRQRLDGEEDEKENAPPLLSTPTRLPEGRSASPASFLPQVLPSAPSTRHTSLVSPIPEANNIDVPILSTSAAVLSFPEPAPSDHTKIVTLPPSTADDIPLLEPPSYALFENLAVASEKDVPGPHCSAHLPGNIPTQGEDTQSPHTASSLSLFSRSSLSSPQPCSSSVQHPLLPKPRTRLVRSNAVPNLQALRAKLTSQDKTAFAEPDFFDTPSIKAGAFNPQPLPTLHSGANVDDHDLVSPSRAVGTRPREWLRQPSVEAELHAFGDRNEGGLKRKRGLEEDEGDREDQPRHLMRAAGPSVVTGQHSTVSLSPDEGGRRRNRPTQDEDQEDRPRQRARRHDGFLMNLLHARFIPQYVQYLW